MNSGYFKAKFSPTRVSFKKVLTDKGKAPLCMCVLGVEADLDATLGHCQPHVSMKLLEVTVLWYLQSIYVPVPSVLSLQKFKDLKPQPL